MKKLLTILLFIPLIGIGQITMSVKASSFQTLGIGSVGVGGSGLEAGKLYICIIGVSFSSGTASAISSIGNTDQTWTEIGTAGGLLSNGNTLRIQAFRTLPSVTATFATNFTYANGANQDGTWAIFYEITGMDASGTNGSGAIVQSVTDAIDANVNPTISMASIGNSANAVIASFINNANPFTGSPESGWTEGVDNGYTTPNTGAYSMHRLTTTDNSPTVTAASSNWSGMAIEIKSATPATNRRRINITKKINTNENPFNFSTVDANCFWAGCVLFDKRRYGCME